MNGRLQVHNWWQRNALAAQDDKDANSTAAIAQCRCSCSYVFHGAWHGLGVRTHCSRVNVTAAPRHYALASDTEAEQRDCVVCALYVVIRIAVRWRCVSSPPLARSRGRHHRLSGDAA